jgi:hypothetical protein
MGASHIHRRSFSTALLPMQDRVWSAAGRLAIATVQGVERKAELV